MYIENPSKESCVPESQMCEFYRAVVWNIVCMSTVVQRILSRFDDTLRSMPDEQLQPILDTLIKKRSNKKTPKLLRQCPVDSTDALRKHIVSRMRLSLDAFQRYMERITNATGADEDFVLDALAYMDSATKQDVNEYLEEGYRMQRANHPECPDCLVLPGSACQFTFIFEDYFKKRMASLGPKVNFPVNVPASFPHLAHSITFLTEVNDILMVNMDYSRPKVVGHERYGELYDNILHKVTSAEIINEAIKAANESNPN